ncbi:MAG: YegS/Rv2252/BmrU family lipid kinase [Bacteroidetes bacterium]|nr:YegS/Rv2252/BmrU family lipid kinase [Bacteroidota bacterium]HET6243321.1 YegS/Rv2252/BmrU family lipid kinase [Bacteroidia bacterium]
MTKRKITFIVNPISGNRKQKDIEISLNRSLNKEIFDFEIIYTTHKGHATELAALAYMNSALVVAVGGDGTINEVSKMLIGKDVPLGIIPTGSGNGFARHWGISRNMDKAIQVINNFNIVRSDTASLNEKLFITTSGCGFDAHIAALFDKSAKRGFITYAKLVLKEFLRYKSLNYFITIDNIEYKKNAFLITVANCSQFGNNAYISPMAISNDGILNITMLKPFPLTAAPGIIFKLFTKQLHKSKFVETFQGKKIQIEHESENAHIDGEAISPGKKLTILVHHHSLNIIVP